MASLARLMRFQCDANGMFCTSTLPLQLGAVQRTGANFPHTNVHCMLFLNVIGTWKNVKFWKFHHKVALYYFRSLQFLVYTGAPMFQKGPTEGDFTKQTTKSKNIIFKSGNRINCNIRFNVFITTRYCILAYWIMDSTLHWWPSSVCKWIFNFESSILCFDLHKTLLDWIYLREHWNLGHKL